MNKLESQIPIDNKIAGSILPHGVVESGEEWLKGNQKFFHVPVLVEEIVHWIARSNPSVIVDCTVGYGGHAEALLRHSPPTVRLIGFDRDPQAIMYSRERLAEFGDRVLLKQGDYRDLKRHLAEMNVSHVGGVVFDLGVSSPQLDDPRRGFSFRADGPLDMRMDQTTGRTAAAVVNEESEPVLANIIYQYGEERYARRIARAIVRSRERKTIETTGELASIIARAVPSAYRYGRIHCATRTFQALRIAVNRELDGLDTALRDAAGVLAWGGRMGVISFHSIEDRIVKHVFRALAQGPAACLSVLTPKPIVPTEGECGANPRARSAKLRVIERKAERTTP
ncbi:MAG: 16S rRNA (cytosine(1402)-N(4))-methyltransferase RsmH [Nitrospira sp.]|nr:16S rRNA (cytosine(1402)-N(4))-methyltransferase RsmH [Nitrospira sp.]MCP9464294.1 16S rRNA (cytosine(1402)-N(4))-methyltransferase RsmH [Nitrospira sp.]